MSGRPTLVLGSITALAALIAIGSDSYPGRTHTSLLLAQTTECPTDRCCYRLQEGRCLADGWYPWSPPFGEFCDPSTGDNFPTRAACRAAAEESGSEGDNEDETNEDDGSSSANSVSSATSSLTAPDEPDDSEEDGGGLQEGTAGGEDTTTEEDDGSGGTPPASEDDDGTGGQEGTTAGNEDEASGSGSAAESPQNDDQEDEDEQTVGEQPGDGGPLDGQQGSGGTQPAGGTQGEAPVDPGGSEPEAGDPGSVTGDGPGSVSDGNSGQDDDAENTGNPIDDLLQDADDLDQQAEEMTEEVRQPSQAQPEEQPAEEASEASQATSETPEPKEPLRPSERQPGCFNRDGDWVTGRPDDCDPNQRRHARGQRIATAEGGEWPVPAVPQSELPAAMARRRIAERLHGPDYNARKTAQFRQTLTDARERLQLLREGYAFSEAAEAYFTRAIDWLERVRGYFTQPRSVREIRLMRRPLEKVLDQAETFAAGVVPPPEERPAIDPILDRTDRLLARFRRGFTLLIRNGLPVDQSALTAYMQAADTFGDIRPVCAEDGRRCRDLEEVLALLGQAEGPLRAALADKPELLKQVETRRD